MLVFQRVSLGNCAPLEDGLFMFWQALLPALTEYEMRPRKRTGKFRLYHLKRRWCMHVSVFQQSHLAGVVPRTFRCEIVKKQNWHILCIYIYTHLHSICLCICMCTSIIYTRYITVRRKYTNYYNVSFTDTVKAVETDCPTADCNDCTGGRKQKPSWLFALIP